MKYITCNVKFSFALLFLFASLLTKANEVTNELTRLVNDWNELHNTRETKHFKELYGGQVLFYGKYRKGSYCATRKGKFLKEDFSQRIISPIKMQFFSSGTVKCSFTKEVTYKQLVKTHPSYLLFKEENGSYRITGESDLQTDQNLNVQLDLGTELTTASDGSGSYSYLLIGSLLIIGFGGFWIYKRKTAQKQAGEELSPYYVSASEPAPALLTESFQQSTRPEQAIPETSALEQQTATLQAERVLSDKEKGDAFENYVLSLFDLKSGRFRIAEWRSDKITTGGHYAMSNHNPDIVLELRDSKGYHRFAVECKWRSNYLNGSIEWAKEYQIRNYQNFQNQMNIPVFIAIGVGGAPDAPQYLYVAELNQIAKYSVLFQSTLKKYNKLVPSSLFYDPYQRTLK